MRHRTAVFQHIQELQQIMLRAQYHTVPLFTAQTTYTGKISDYILDGQDIILLQYILPSSMNPLFPAREANSAVPLNNAGPPLFNGGPSFQLNAAGT